MTYTGRASSEPKRLTPINFRFFHSQNGEAGENGEGGKVLISYFFTCFGQPERSTSGLCMNS